MRKLFLFFLIIAFVSCEKPTLDEFQYVFINEGDHYALPYWISYEKRSELSTQYVFTDFASYNLGDADQKDWNKLIGLSFHAFTNHKNSSMVSWRYNVSDEIFELGFYFHKDGARIIASDDSDQVFARTKKEVKTYIRIDDEVNSVDLKIVTPLDTVSLNMKYTIDLDRRTRVINTYFGGNRSAPNDIHLLRKLIEY